MVGRCASRAGFILPGFCMLLALTLLYHHYGALPRIRHVFYGLNPVVVGIFAMSVYRLGRAAVREWTHILLTVASALAIGLTPLGIVPTLLLAGAAGVALYGSRTWGLVATLVILVLYGATQWGARGGPSLPSRAQYRPSECPQPESLGDGTLLPEGRCLYLWGRIDHFGVYPRAGRQSVALADAAAIPGWSSPGATHPRADPHPGRLRGLYRRHLLGRWWQ